MPTNVDALEGMLVALLVGLLIGLDRERAEARKRRKLFAGIRTFPIIGLLGAGLSLLRVEAGPWPLVVGLLAVGGIALVSYQRAARRGQVGATTEVAALATFTLGALAGMGQLLVAGAIGVVVALLLVAKPRLERLSRAISEVELSAVLELAVISAIVLPILPDQGYGPWQTLNPFRIWLVVVIVSAVSFAGFVAVRWKGERAGIFLSAALGALASSTATTVALAQRSREAPEHGRLLAAASTLASTVMCLRVGFLVGAVRPAVLPSVAPALGAMAAVGGLATLLLARRASPRQALRESPSVSNPFSLRAALVFGAIYAATLLAVRAAGVWLGTSGTLAAAALSGLVDVDAISLALARDAHVLGSVRAALGIMIACATNNVFKVVVGVARGAGALRRDLALAVGAMTLAGGVVITLTVVRS